MHDLCSTYPGARGPVSREVVVPSSGKGRLGPARAAEDLLANTNRLLSARSAEVEDLHLRCADMKAEAVTAREQTAPLAARVKELEEGLT